MQNMYTQASISDHVSASLQESEWRRSFKKSDVYVDTEWCVTAGVQLLRLRTWRDRHRRRVGEDASSDRLA